MDLNQIQNRIEPSLVDLGYEIVRISVQGNELKTLQIMAERKDRQDMTVEDCSKISQTASALLDIEDPFPGKWVLEVSSPGIDRPLVKIEDYSRFIEKNAKIEINHEINGRRRFKCILKGTNAQNVLICFEGENIEIPFKEIVKAKLILPEEIFNSKKGAKK